MKPVKPSQTSPTFQPASISSLNFPIEKLTGLSAEDYQKLKNHGVQTTRDLIKRAGSHKSEKEAFAIAIGVRLQLLTKWLAFADLARIPAVGLQHCGIIVHSGIISLEQLAQTPLDKLHKQILRLQVQQFRRADLCPDIAEMAVWIKQAQQLLKNSA